MWGTSWKTISKSEYELAFERFGGSFAVHPRVVELVASLAKRPVRYAGAIAKGNLVAAVPLWGQAILATKLSLEIYKVSHLIDVGDSEVVLPVADNVQITMPFMASMLSSLHSINIENIKREAVGIALAKGLKIGDQRHSSKSQSQRRRELRRFAEAGGKFLSTADLTTDEAAAIFIGLYRKRWGGTPQGEAFLPTVFREFKDMLCGDVLLFNDRPVAIDLMYRHQTSRYLFVNGVQRGLDPQIADYSLGTMLLFHNLGLQEEEAIANGKVLRFSFGRNDADYKAIWAFDAPCYRLVTLAGSMRSLRMRVIGKAAAELTRISGMVKGHEVVE